MKDVIERKGFTWALVGTLMYSEDAPDLLEKLRQRYPEYYIIRATNIYSEERLIKFGVYRRV